MKYFLLPMVLLCAMIVVATLITNDKKEINNNVGVDSIINVSIKEDTSILYPILSGIFVWRVPDTAAITPISKYRVNPSYASRKNTKVYDFVIGGNTTPSLTIDTLGNIIINDSLQSIRALLWCLKSGVKIN